MATDNQQEIQYQILQEAHETAHQLSASQEHGIGVTVVEVKNDETHELTAVESSGNPSENMINGITIVTESDTGQHYQTVASGPQIITTTESDDTGQHYQTVASGPQIITTTGSDDTGQHYRTVASGPQIITTSSGTAQIVTIQRTEEQPGTLVMGAGDSVPSEAAVRTVVKEVVSTPQHVITPMSMHQVPAGVPDIHQDSLGEIMLCQVCGDRGSGYHYSVFSCEGCKGFFKRTVQKNLQYHCKDDGNCDVNKFTRNSCQFCRFKKCSEQGMKREAVREDRQPGGKHRHKRLRTEDSLVIPNEPVDEIMLGKLVDARPDLIPSAEDMAAGPDGSPQLDVNSLMQYGYMELRLIIEWARKVPGFAELLIEDQMALLKASFMELNILRLAFRSLNDDGFVKFAQGIAMSPEGCQQLGWGKDLVTCTLEFVGRLKEINIDNTEFCILNAIVLTYPDAHGVLDKTAVINLQRNILDNFRKYSINQYPMEPRRYGKMLLRLPSLRTISAIAAERFLSMSLDSSVKMNALVLEMMS